MCAAGARKFEPFACAAVLNGEVRVQRMAFDPSVLRVELARIGDNVNQIARHVNAELGVTFEDMRATRMLSTHVQVSISRALSQVVEGD